MDYSRTEENWNIITHALGVVLSIVGLIYLITQTIHLEDKLALISCTVFASSMILLYSASTTYHAIADEKWKKIFKKLDHLAIYLLIAGTYTPFCLLALQGIWGTSIFIGIWSLVVVGFVFKFSPWQKNKIISVALYALMGWLAIVAIYPMFQNLPSNQLWLIVLGGLFYTGGILFYVNNKIPMNHAIWHLFVLAGNGFHFAFVVNLLGEI